MGQVHKTIVTQLELLEPVSARVAAPRGKFLLIRAEKPPLHFYRYLYRIVGEKYFWVTRRNLSDEALAAIIHDPDVEIYQLILNGAPAGFFELDFRQLPQVELSFLGLIPEKVGQGLGRYLLSEAIETAWMRTPTRMIVQTCTLDHPRALALYQRFGFKPYNRLEAEIEEPGPMAP